MITSLPWYRDHAVEPGWEGRLVRSEKTAWGRVSRIHPFPTDKRNLPARAAAFGGFTTLATMVGARSHGRVDGVLAMSPPLTLGLAGWALARPRRVPFVFNIQDVFPDVAVELGMLTDPRVIGAARRIERLVYARADAVTVLSDDLRSNVAAKIGSRGSGKVRVIPNFVDIERFSPDVDAGRYRREHDLIGKRVVMYAGNVGHSQPLDLLIDAARRLVDRTDVVFVVNGGGVARRSLERAAADLPNVRFVDYQPRERLAEVIAAGDIHIVPLKAGLARSSVPSKLYSILAGGRPVVASVDSGTEVARTVERAGAGIAVRPDEPGAFVAALRVLLDDPERAESCGAAGRTFVEAWASPAAVAREYVDLFAELGAR